MTAVLSNLHSTIMAYVPQHLPKPLLLPENLDWQQVAANPYASHAFHPWSLDFLVGCGQKVTPRKVQRPRPASHWHPTWQSLGLLGGWLYAVKLHSAAATWHCWEGCIWQSNWINQSKAVLLGAAACVGYVLYMAASIGLWLLLPVQFLNHGWHRLLLVPNPNHYEAQRNEILDHVKYLSKKIEDLPNKIENKTKILYNSLTAELEEMLKQLALIKTESPQKKSPKRNFKVRWRSRAINNKQGDDVTT